MKALKHFITITRHKLLMLKYCFRVGLYRQGLTHDLSKYLPHEFLTGVKYYQGDKSPNVAERHDKGYSEAWMHHKGRNPHHFEYWTDYGPNPGRGLLPIPMPREYLVESLLDRIAACRVYNGGSYTDADAYNYLQRSRDAHGMHERTREELSLLLKMLADKGEDETFDYIKRVFLSKERPLVPEVETLNHAVEE